LTATIESLESEVAAAATPSQEFERLRSDLDDLDIANSSLGSQVRALEGKVSGLARCVGDYQEKQRLSSYSGQGFQFVNCVLWAL
jgi:hypothetical protein